MNLLAHAVILGESLAVAVEKVPIEGGERAGVFAHPLLRVIGAALAELGHSAQVAPAGGVRLGHEFASIGVNRHADDVRHHHPFGGVDELLSHPVEKFLRISACHQGQVAEHHQSRNVMHPCALLDAGDHILHARHFGFR